MPDPNDYSAVLVMSGYGALKAGVAAASAKLQADGQVLAAREMREAFAELSDRLLVIANDVAQTAEQEIVDAEQHSRVRPDTQGDGGPRLEDYVGESAAFATVPGTVLVNNERLLDDNVPWWITNEEGSSKLVGRRIQGYFTDSAGGARSKPSMAEFRQHPLFEGAIVGADKKGALIQNPIPARRFVEDGYKRAESDWHAQVRAAKAHFDTRIRRASVLARGGTP
jgi:hypothetical protein